MPISGLTVPTAQLPLHVEVGQVVLVNGDVRARLYIEHPCGVSVFIMAPDLAEGVGRALQRVGQAGQLLIDPSSPAGPLRTS